MNDEIPRLVPATTAHVLQMKAWFPTARSCAIWGGPAFRFPFTDETFLEDSKLAELPSFVLVAQSNDVRGFGQFYRRAGRCHLGRLAIAPEHRGRGLGTRLIRLLMHEGMGRLGTAECSLFVHVSNTAALALYERLGFRRTEYPEAGQSLADCHYLVMPAR